MGDGVANVVGLDLSLVATGVCLADGSTERLAPAKALGHGIERLNWLRDRVMDICEDHWEKRHAKFDLVVIEGYSFNSRVGGEHLGELGGIVRLALWDQGQRTGVLPPANLKKLATGRGNATKPDMRTERFKRTGVDERDDNLNDAFWLRQAGLCWLEISDPLLVLPADYLPMPASNREAVAKMALLDAEGVPV